MRIEGKCCDDCAQCKLLQNGDVDMIPCILDQLFRRVQRIEREIEKGNKIVLINNEGKDDIL